MQISSTWCNSQFNNVTATSLYAVLLKCSGVHTEEALFNAQLAYYYYVKQLLTAPFLVLTIVVWSSMFAMLNTFKLHSGEKVEVLCSVPLPTWCINLHWFSPNWPMPVWWPLNKSAPGFTLEVILILIPSFNFCLWPRILFDNLLGRPTATGTG